MLESRYAYISLCVFLMMISMIAGYQYHRYQDEQSIKAFFNVKSIAKAAANPADFWDIGVDHEKTGQSS